MDIKLDVGHWALLIIIGVMWAREMWSSYLVMKERDRLTNKMLAKDGVLAEYAAGVKTLEEPTRKTPTLEEAEAVLDEFDLQDQIDVD